MGVANGVGVAEGVGVTSSWLFCSVSGEERREEHAPLSMEEELDGGRAVTVEEEPEEEEEETDLGRGSAGAVGAAGASTASVAGVSTSITLSADTTAGSCAGVCVPEVANVPSGRAAVPEAKSSNLELNFLSRGHLITDFTPFPVTHDSTHHSMDDVN